MTSVANFQNRITTEEDGPDIPLFETPIYMIVELNRFAGILADPSSKMTPEDFSELAKEVDALYNIVHPPDCFNERLEALERKVFLLEAPRVLDEIFPMTKSVTR